jgi:hypothetical protein
LRRQGVKTFQDYGPAKDCVEGQPIQQGSTSGFPDGFPKKTSFPAVGESNQTESLRENLFLFMSG